MEPTIIVVSESGLYLGSTYPKRAEGLIKKGRAFWDPLHEKGKVLVLKRKWKEEVEDNESKSDL